MPLGARLLGQGTEDFAERFLSDADGRRKIAVHQISITSFSLAWLMSSIFLISPSVSF
jgi:hypothetical protein